MNVKIDTKEKFTVITPLEINLSANMTEDMQKILKAHLLKDIPHTVFNMDSIASIDAEAAAALLSVQQTYYDNKASFVICSLQQPVEDFLDKLDLLSMMNVTPTESEAWDIVQMEEIERELLNDFDEDL